MKYTEPEEVAVASLTDEQLQILQTVEMDINGQDEQNPIYLVAFRKND